LPLDHLTLERNRKGRAEMLALFLLFTQSREGRSLAGTCLESLPFFKLTAAQRR
jgi:hypothetical protein